MKNHFCLTAARVPGAFGTQLKTGFPLQRFAQGHPGGSITHQENLILITLLLNG